MMFALMIAYFKLWDRRRRTLARQNIMTAHGQFPSEMRIDRVWAIRDNQQGWQNVHRLHQYLTKRHMWEKDSTADLSAVNVGFPTLGLEGECPDKVMVELIKTYEALRVGDYEAVERFDD